MEKRIFAISLAVYFGKRVRKLRRDCDGLCANRWLFCHSSRDANAREGSGGVVLVAARVLRYRVRWRRLHGCALRSEEVFPRACLTGAPAEGAVAAAAGGCWRTAGPSWSVPGLLRSEHDDETSPSGDVAAAGSRPVAPSADRSGSVREPRAAGHRGGEFSAPLRLVGRSAPRSGSGFAWSCVWFCCFKDNVLFSQTSPHDKASIF